MSRHPEIVWAQRSESVCLTVELPDAKDPKVSVTPEGKFTYSAAVGSDNQSYEAELELFGPVDVEKSKFHIGLRHTFCVLQKQETGWWKRLLKAEGKTPPYVKVDWNRWVDEDEEDEKPAGMDNFNMSSMGDFGSFFAVQGMGGMGGMGGLEGMMGGMGGMGGLGGLGGMGDMGAMGDMGDEDEDEDDEIPALEK
eukprot:jgi/Mesen1/2712/ME000168S01798